MQYHAILFDMDGVIIDTRDAVTDFWNAQAARLGTTLSGTDFERDIYGCLPGYTIDRLFPQLSPPERRQVLDELDASERVQIYHPIPGAVELLRALSRNGLPTALVTSGNQNKIRAMSRQLELDGLFNVLVGAEEIKRGKPAPDGYLAAARQLNYLPSECVVFEDAVSGVQAAVSAGALCIGVQCPEQAPPLVAVGATEVVPDFTRVRLVSNGRAGSFECFQLDLGARKLDLVTR